MATQAAFAAFAASAAAQAAATATEAASSTSRSASSAASWAARSASDVEVQPVIKRVARSEAEIVPLPGRTWHSYFGPWNSAAQHVSMGVSVFPPGSRPEGHVHPAEEETIYCAAGRGRIVTPDGIAEVEPGVVVHVSPGTHHATEADGPEPLELVCLFSPPVVSGSYEKKAGS